MRSCLSVLGLLGLVAVCFGTFHSEDRIIDEINGGDLILRSIMPGASHRRQWYVSMDVDGDDRGYKRKDPPNVKLSIDLRHLQDDHRYKFTVCEDRPWFASGRRRCASLVWFQMTECSDKPADGFQWPAFTHEGPAQLPCHAPKGYDEADVYKNGYRTDVPHTVGDRLKDYGQYTCRAIQYVGDSYDYDEACYTETTTQYLPKDCGHSTDPAAFHVELHHRHDMGEGEPYCSGVLISGQWVLTAAHCVKGQKAAHKGVDSNLYFNIRVRAGPSGHQQVRNIKARRDIVAHPKFKDHHHHIHDDLALLKLSSPMELGRHVQPVCLGRGNLLKDYINATDAKLVKTGREQKDVVVKDTCGSHCHTSPKGFCLSALHGQGYATCEGDSGSPYLLPINRQYFLGGLLSYGIGTCSVCSHFTKVHAYYDWIASEVDP